MTDPRTRIFVVEDEALIAMELESRLESMGYEVVGTVARGEDAVEAVPAAAPDLVLMDIRLAGEMSGVDTASALSELVDVPVVFLSAFSDESLVRGALEVRPFGYLVKPFEERELHLTIQAALVHHRLEAQLKHALSSVERHARVLEEKERFVRGVLDAVGAMVVVLDHEGRIIETNKAWRDFGLANGLSTDLLGESYLDVCDRTTGRDARDARRVARAIRSVIDGGADHVVYEYSMPTPQGHRWFVCRVAPIHATGPGRVVVSHEDVTAVQDALERALDGERVFTSLSQLAPVGIFRTDPDGAVTHVSRRWTEITGLTEEDATDRGWAQAVHREDRRALVEAWMEATAAREPFEAEVRFVRAEGDVRWVIAEAIPIPGQDGDVSGYIGTITDVTERRALQERLSHSVKMEAIGNLTGGMAHDFNNYLGVILGNMGLLRERGGWDATAEELIEGVMMGARKGAEVTRSLLAFARRQPLAPRPTDVNERIQGMLDLLGRTLGGHIEMEMDLAPDLWTTTVDASQFDSCILNLTGNARDAMPDGGRIRIRTRNVPRLDFPAHALSEAVPPGDYIAIEVSDTGYGIDPVDLPRVTEPFFTTKGPGHGTGLGLSMVYGFVSQSGGHVDIESDVGRGTTVTLFLPRTRPS